MGVGVGYGRGIAPRCVSREQSGSARTRDCGTLAALGVANEADGVGGRERGQRLHGQQDGVAPANAARVHEQHEQRALGRKEAGKRADAVQAAHVLPVALR